MGTGASSQGTSSAGSRGSSNQSSEASEKSNRIQQALKQGEDLDEYSISEIAKCRLEHPKVAPSTKKKDEIFIASSHTKEAERVKNTSNLVKLSSRELVDALTEGLEDDMSKLRVIFLFIASIDLSQLSEPEDEDYSTNGPLAYLLKMKQFQGNHAHLFCALCKIAGLPCEIILGYNKSAAYQIGKPIDLKKMLAQWNAVYVCGEWRLIDCFWSCACVVGGEDESEWDVLDVDGRIVTGKKIAGSGQMTHRINEFFFLTNPEMLLATHIPKNEVWQLTPKDSVTTIEKFEEEVYRRERFFELGMKVPRDDLSKCRLVADAGEITIELAITDDSPSIDFKYMLFMGKGGEDVGKLEKFVMFQRGTGSITYKASIPVKGVFKLDVFGKDSRRHKSLDLVCSYLIDAVTGSQEKEPLPDDPAIGWGPDGGYLAAYGMEALTPHDKGVIYTDTGILDIKYKMEQPLELLSLMLSNTHSKEKLGQYVYMEVGGECIIHVRLPESGVYACELFASEEGIPGELQNVCNYVIKCNKKVKNDPLPYVPNGRIGGFSMTKDLGIELLDPLNPEIITEDGKVKIKIKAPAGVKLHGAMHHPNQSTEASNKQIGMSQDGDTVTFDLDLLLSGKSCFAIYASMPGDSQVHNVCNFMIDNKAASKGKPSKSGTDLPDIETIHVRNGKAELSLTHTEAENVAACLYKDGAYLPQTPGQVTVKQDGVVSKVTIKIPEDGTYELQLHEKDKDGKSILTKKRYRLIHEGGVPDTIEEEPQEEEQHEEEETMHVEEDVTANETEEDPVKAEQEKKYRELRQKLAAAIESGDEKELEATMKEFNAANVPDPNNLYERAERDLAIIRARRALNAAMNQEDTKVLQNAISQAQSIKHKGKLSSEISDAQRLLEKLKRIEKLRHAVLKLDQRTIAEIKSFATPPIVIEQVMRATLLLLGSNKKEMKDWKGVVVLIGKTGKESLKRRVMEFKVKNLKPELAAEVKTMFSKFDLIEVRDGSSGAATFYIWGMGMIEEAELASGVKK